MADSKLEMETDDGNEVITASQEAELLHEKQTSALNVTAAPPAEGISANAPKPANLSDLKRMIESNGNFTGGELLMSLQIGEVIVTKPHRSRSRDKARRLEAKSQSKSNVNPHERVKDDLVSGTPKRGRDTGGTPPSANQPKKKMHGDLQETNVDHESNTLSKKEKKRLKNKMRRRNKTLSSNKNAGNQTEAAKSVPPLASVPKSIGSDTAATGGSQPNAGNQSAAMTPAPSVAPESHSSGADVGAATDNQSRALPLGGGTVKPHGQTVNINEDGEPPLSYAQVVDNLCVAIIDERRPGNMQLLDQARFDKLNTLLTDTIMSMIGSKTELPAFDDTRLHGGAMRVRCANTYTRTWLKTNVSKLDVKKLWPGAKMVMIDFKDLPKPHKFNVIFRGILKSAKDIFSLLQTQNPGIITKSWSVLHCAQKNGGTHMTIGVGQDSYETLRAHSNSLYCGMGKAIFTAVKSCKVNQLSTQKAAASTRATASDTGNPVAPDVSQTGKGLNTDTTVTISDTPVTGPEEMDTN